MSIVVRMKDGSTVFLDRRLYVHTVAGAVNDERSAAAEAGRLTQLIEFQDDQTPSRSVYIDPAEVATVRDDR